MANPWDDIRVALEIHRAGSLTAAGVELGINQSTMGRRLAALEARLASKLFVRTADGFVATPAGERLVARAAAMEAEVLAMERESAGDEAVLSGTVRLTAPQAFGATIVTPLLAQLHERWPQITLDFIADDRALSLSRREADLAIRTGRPPPDAATVRRRVGELRNGLYASRAYIARRGMPRRGFGGHDFVASDSGWRDSSWMAEHLPGVHVALRSSSTAVHLAAVRAGIGIGLLSAYHVHGDPEIVEVKPPVPLFREELWLAIHRDVQRNARVRACADFLAQAIIALGPRLAGGR